MTSNTIEKTMSFRRAFEAEHARRDAERHAKEEAERLQLERDLAQAQALYDLIAQDKAFLEEKGVTLELRRYTVNLSHQDFVIDTYFEDGDIRVRSADRRTATTNTGVPKKSAHVASVEEALDLMANYLADETQ